MKSKFLRGLVGISMLAAVSLVAEDLSNTSYYDCGYDSANPSKCFLYMPASKVLATHTAGTLDDYAQVNGEVEATFSNGVLTLPEITGLSDSDNAALSNRSDSVNYYYIQQNVKGADGKPMFYLYSAEGDYLAEHEAGKMGAANVTNLTDTTLASGSFSFDIATGTASVTPTATPTPTPTSDMSLTPPGVTDIPTPF